MELTNKTITRLEKERSKETEKLAALTVKKDELDAQIKAAQDAVKNIDTEIRQEKILMIAKAADKSGFNLDEVYAMFTSNGSSKKEKTETPATAADTVTDTENTADYDTDITSEAGGAESSYDN